MRQFNENDIEQEIPEEVQKTEAEIAFDKKVEALAKEIREKSKREILFTESMALKKPLEISVDGIKEVFTGLSKEEYNDISSIEGSKYTYYYSQESMTSSFAKTLSLITDRDLYRLFAEVIRKDSKLYKRTTNPMFFTELPYSLTKLQLKDIQEHIGNRGEYSDIKTVTASNGILNFYSEQHLSQVYAKSLCEWQEVERFECF